MHKFLYKYMQFFKDEDINNMDSGVYISSKWNL